MVNERSMKSTNIKWHAATITKAQREAALGSRGAVIWLTGLSGSGKSTIGRRLEQRLLELGVFTYMLDGDNLRYGLNSDLGFSAEDRTENIRRVGEVSALFADAGVIAIAAFISPYRTDRQAVRIKLPEGRFIEVHVATSLSECESRDPKGLYQKARRGEIQNFTGISAPYEEPLSPEHALFTKDKTVDDCVEELLVLLRDMRVLLQN